MLHAVCLVQRFQLGIPESLTQVMYRSWLPHGEHDKQEATVTDQILADPDCDMDNLMTTPVNELLDNLISTFTPSQKRAFEWVQGQLELGKPLQVAIVGPGKSYL